MRTIQMVGFRDHRRVPHQERHPKGTNRSGDDRRVQKDGRVLLVDTDGLKGVEILLTHTQHKINKRKNLQIGKCYNRVVRLSET